MDIDLNNSDCIFNYILNNNDFNDSNYIEKINNIEKKVSEHISNQQLTDITKNFRNFNHDLTWIKNTYINLVITHTTESLINPRILSFYENLKK